MMYEREVCTQQAEPVIADLIDKVIESSRFGRVRQPTME